MGASQATLSCKRRPAACSAACASAGSGPRPTRAATLRVMVHTSYNAVQMMLDFALNHFDRTRESILHPGCCAHQLGCVDCASRQLVPYTCGILYPKCTLRYLQMH